MITYQIQGEKYCFLKSWDKNETHGNPCSNKNCKCINPFDNDYLLRYDCYADKIKEMAIFLENEANRLKKQSNLLWREYCKLMNTSHHTD